MSANDEILSPSPAVVNHYSSPPVTIVLTVILLILFFLGFFSIYFCRCFFNGAADTWHFRRGSSRQNANPADAANRPGLDPVLIQYFPTFAYSDVKDIGQRKCGLECAICLGDFKDDDILRLLTVCYHVFHQECIDLWLESHKTCPVCRGDLDLPAESLEKSPARIQDDNPSEHAEPNRMSDHDAISITIRDDVDEEGLNRHHIQSSSSYHNLMQQNGNKEKFSRSHSTGHDSSVAGNEEVSDKHTLRLPDDTKIMIRTGHNWTRSCITFGEFTALSPYRAKATGGGGGGHAESSGCSNAVATTSDS
ncbi:hypothetical protein ACFE04_031576 [Oxalis oulophora]